jgi:hypothetical protein
VVPSPTIQAGVVRLAFKVASRKGPGKTFCLNRPARVNVYAARQSARVIAIFCSVKIRSPRLEIQTARHICLW